MGISQQEFKRLWQRIQEEPTHYSLSQLNAMIASPAAHQRLSALFIMRKQIEEGIPPAAFLPLAQALVSDADNYCRWQALIVIGESVETDPEQVWQVVEKFGASDDADMRAGVACVLLEELLAHHFATYFPIVQERVESGDEAFAATFSICWKHGQTEEAENAALFDSLQAAIGREQE
jgi:hypothetical protein